MTGSPTAALLAELCAGLSPQRAEALRRAHELVRSVIPAGYEEVTAGRLIAWVIPLERFPKTYNKQPLMVVALAATKGHNALHLPLLYMSAERAAAFQQAYAQAGQKLDMGKGCVRFKAVADLNEAAITQAIAPVPVEDFVATYEAARSGASAAA